MSTAETIRRARESNFAVGGFTFTLRRPTPFQLGRLVRAPEAEGALRYVVGWKGVREIDVVPGGSDRELPFDADACYEWLSDRPDIAEPIIVEIFRLGGEFARRQETAEKN